MLKHHSKLVLCLSKLPRKFVIIAILAFSALSGTASLAQVVILPGAGPRTLSGIITDTLGTPIPNADVQIVSLNLRTRSGVDGTFRFNEIAPGTYRINARSIGHVAPSQTVVVGEQGGSVRIAMIRFATVLPSRVTSAVQTGLGGIIGDTAYRALPGVKVTVIGGAKETVTDSAGAFFVSLPEGKYVLRLEREGYARQIMGVTIPKEEGRRVAAWMVPHAGPANIIEAQALFDLAQRMVRVSPASSKFFSRGDLEAKNILDLQALARQWSNGQISTECTVTIGGTMGVQIPLATVITSDVEFVELYLQSKADGGGGTRGVTSMNGSNTAITASTSVRPGTKKECGNLSLLVWLRN